MRELRMVHQGATQRSVKTPGYAPGKRTQVMAEASDGAEIQCKPDPIQRQGSAEAPPPDPVYQYADGTTHINDCGPASLVGILRMMQLEATLNAWILAHRPVENDAIAPWYQERYPGAQPGAVDPQEQLDVSRMCVFTSPQGLMRENYRLGLPTQADAVLTAPQLRTGLVCMLQILGAQIPENVNELLPLASEGEDNLRGVDAASSNSRGDLLRYLYRHCAGDQAVILLGSPTSWQQDENGRAVEVPAWGWGGDTPSAGGRTVPIDPGAGHFVIVHSFNRGTKMFTLLDPSFARPQQVTRDQLVEFITNRGGTLANMLTVPLATVQSWMPAAQPKRGGGAMAANVPAPTGGGASLPWATQARMERSFGADFSSVRVHEGDGAAQIGALGYTQGNDVHFAPGQYRPGTTAGDTLIGHELAHVVQQREGRVAAPQGKGGIVEDPALEAEADQQGERAAAGRPARSASSSQQVGAAVVQRQDAGGGAATPTPTLSIPPGPIPEPMLQALARMPSMAIHVASWCTAHLLQREQMRSFWASADPATRGAQLGEMAVQLGRLEFMLGWIQQGGLTIATTAGWETRGTSADNLSREDGDASSNRGTFPGRYQSQYGGEAGMAGYDWCGMFIGYLYSDLLQLDDPGMGSAGTEGWRGADTVLQSGEPKIWPSREVADPARFGQFLSWGDGGPPRAGDVLVISPDAFTQEVGAAIAGGSSDPRTPTHVGMVEEATDAYVRTIDGNVSLLTTSIPGSSEGARSPNAVSARAYNLAAQYTDREGEVYHYNHSRIICAVRITDREGNFAAPASDTPPVTAAEIQARLVAANAQVEAVLNSLSGTSRPFSAQGTVREWARGQGA